jgi:heptaprenyl diphosphate synthase
MDRIIYNFKTKSKDIQHFYLLFFIALTVALSFFEYLIPKPLPWLKIGLGNAVILAFILCKNYREAFIISILKPIIISIFIGTIFSPGFFLSFFGSLISASFMIIFHKFFRKFLSHFGISLIGAYSHSLTQVLIAYVFRLVLNLNGVFIILGIITLMSIFGAIITGYIALRLVKRL